MSKIVELLLHHQVRKIFAHSNLKFTIEGELRFDKSYFLHSSQVIMLCLLKFIIFQVNVKFVHQLL